MAPPCIDGRTEHAWLSMHPEWAAIQHADGRTHQEHACPHCLTSRHQSWRLIGSRVRVEYGRYSLLDVEALPPLAEARARLGLPTQAPTFIIPEPSVRAA